MDSSPSNAALPFWHRSRLRWINGLGFAISSALALMTVLGVLASLVPDADPLRFRFPVVYAVLAFGALLVMLALFGILLFRFAWRGERFDSYQGRLCVFFWSLAGGLFFLVLAIIRLRFGSPSLPNQAAWATDFLWFLCPFGVATFGLMSWTNSDIPHADEHHAGGHHEDDDHDDDYDERDAAERDAAERDSRAR